MYSRSGKQIPRKQARRAEKLEKKQRRAEYFSHGATSLKRRATNEPEGPPSKKRVKREAGHQETMNVIKSTQKASGKPAKESEMTPKAARSSRTAFAKLASRQVKLAKSVQSQAETGEDQEIAWLEYKLGIKGNKSKIFEEDGLGGMVPKVMS
jgi:nucleolar MIF4G domain-containing protein 1